MPETKRTTRTPKSKAAQPVTDYGRIQPQAPELEQGRAGRTDDREGCLLAGERDTAPRTRSTSTATSSSTLPLPTWPSTRNRWTSSPLRSNWPSGESWTRWAVLSTSPQLSSKVASSAHIEFHARIIAQKALARELITFTSQIQSKAFDETLDVDDLMQEAEEGSLKSRSRT